MVVENKVKRTGDTSEPSIRCKRHSQILSRARKADQVARQRRLDQPVFRDKI
jgi:hypothetical protein